jgi:hypothetical protein
MDKNTFLSLDGFIEGTSKKAVIRKKKCRKCYKWKKITNFFIPVFM